MKVERKRNSGYSDEFKRQVLDELKVTGIVDVSHKYKVSHTAIYKWLKQTENTEIEYHPEQKLEYTEEFITDVLNDVEIIGVTSAERKYLVHHTTIYDWIKQRSIDGKAYEPLETIRPYPIYDEDFKRNVANDAAIIGTHDAALKYHVGESSITRWKRLFGIGANKAKRYKKEIKALILIDAKQHGVRFASQKHDVSENTIYNWIESENLDQGIPTKSVGRKGVYTDQFRAKVVSSAKAMGIKAAAEKFGLSYGTVYDWVAKDR